MDHFFEMEENDFSWGKFDLGGTSFRKWGKMGDHPLTQFYFNQDYPI